jgi:hypothetical protein
VVVLVVSCSVVGCTCKGRVCVVRGMVWCVVPVRGMGTLIWCMSCWNWPLRMPSRPSSEYGGPTSSAYMLATTWLVPETEKKHINNVSKSFSVEN